MQVVYVIVKGNRFDAAREAAKRGIPFVYRREGNERRETVGMVPMDFAPAVREWFHESPVLQKAPFPVGTVLTFSEGESNC